MSVCRCQDNSFFSNCVCLSKCGFLLFQAIIFPHGPSSTLFHLLSETVLVASVCLLSFCFPLPTYLFTWACLSVATLLTLVSSPFFQSMLPLYSNLFTTHIFPNITHPSFLYINSLYPSLYDITSPLSTSFHPLSLFFSISPIPLSLSLFISLPFNRSLYLITLPPHYFSSLPYLLYFTTLFPSIYFIRLFLPPSIFFTPFSLPLFPPVLSLPLFSHYLSLPALSPPTPSSSLTAYSLFLSHHPPCLFRLLFLIVHGSTKTWSRACSPEHVYTPPPPLWLRLHL